jgi:hypothetical protein
MISRPREAAALVKNLQDEFENHRLPVNMELDLQS